jgi:DNA-binding protein HU-beta
MNAKNPRKNGLFSLLHPVLPFMIDIDWTRVRTNYAPGRIGLTRRNMAATRMTQTQLVKSLAESNEVSNKTAKAILEGLASLAIAEVKKNGVFVLPGIGRLVRQDRKARTGRNPATGETIKIPAKKVVKFRVAKAAKDAIVPPKKAK